MAPSDAPPGATPLSRYAAMADADASGRGCGALAWEGALRLSTDFVPAGALVADGSLGLRVDGRPCTGFAAEAARVFSRAGVSPDDAPGRLASMAAPCFLACRTPESP